jgi:hypothetical protein
MEAHAHFWYFGTVFNLPSSDVLRDHYPQLKPRNVGTYSRASSMLAMLIQFETFTCTRKTSGASTGLKPAGAPYRYGLFSLLKIPILRIHVRTPGKKDQGLNCPSICKKESSRSSPRGRRKAMCAQESFVSRKSAALGQNPNVQWVVNIHMGHPQDCDQDRKSIGRSLG